METPVLSVLQIYGLAILLGALMGLERERGQEHMAGLRTFILVTLFGCICARISQAASEPWIIPSGMVAIIVLAAVGHFTMTRENATTGLTTWVALVVAFGIGALVGFEQTVAAVALSLATTVILYFKSILHNFSHSLSERDIYAIFQFGLIAFVILPILPDRGFGPYKVLNPHNIWLMVVLVSAINLAGYLILKFGKKHWSGPMVGILGGTISSTATTLCFARRAHENHGFSMMGAMIVALASTTVLVRMTLLIGIIHSELLRSLALPMTGMFLSGLVPVFYLWRKTRSQETPDPEKKPGGDRTGPVLRGGLRRDPAGSGRCQGLPGEQGRLYRVSDIRPDGRGRHHPFQRAHGRGGESPGKSCRRQHPHRLYFQPGVQTGDGGDRRHPADV